MLLRAVGHCSAGRCTVRCCMALYTVGCCRVGTAEYHTAIEWSWSSPIETSSLPSHENAKQRTASVWYLSTVRIASVGLRADHTAIHTYVRENPRVSSKQGSIADGV